MTNIYNNSVKFLDKLIYRLFCRKLELKIMIFEDEIRILSWKLAISSNERWSLMLSSGFPQVKFSPRKVHFPHLHFLQNRQFLFSANFRQTRKLNKSSKFYYYKEYSLKAHVSNFRNGGKLTFRGGKLTWGNFIQKMGDHCNEILGD